MSSAVVLDQLPTLPPDTYDDVCPWDTKLTLEEWVSERVLRLTCTGDGMRPLAEVAGFKLKVVKWKEADRAVLCAELDAAFFRLYGLTDDDIEYVIGTFQAIAKDDKSHHGVGRTRELIRNALAQMPPL